MGISWLMFFFFRSLNIWPRKAWYHGPMSSMYSRRRKSSIWREKQWNMRKHPWSIMGSSMGLSWNEIKIGINIWIIYGIIYGLWDYQQTWGLNAATGNGLVWFARILPGVRIHAGNIPDGHFTSCGSKQTMWTMNQWSNDWLISGDIYPLVNEHNYGQSPFFNGKTHYKWWFSIVMLSLPEGNLKRPHSMVPYPSLHPPWFLGAFSKATEHPAAHCGDAWPCLGFRGWENHGYNLW